MQKNIFQLILWLFTTSAFAEGYLSAKIIYTDGRQDIGLVDTLIYPGDKKIHFKSNSSAEKVKIDSNLLQRIVIYVDNDSIEYERIKAIRPTNGKLSDPGWLKVVLRGYATLYYATIQGQVVTANGHSLTIPDEHDCYCIRNGEAGCSIISSNFAGCVNPNSYLRKLGPMNFADAPDIVAQINNHTYTWKTISEMVADYNKIKEETK